MIAAYVAESFVDSPAGTAVMTVVAAAAVSVIGAIVKMMFDVAGLVGAVREIRDDIREIKGDPDVMRWSEYSMPILQAKRRPRRGRDDG